MFFVGVSYSMVAASLWPCIPLIVKKHEMGTCYGLFFAIQNGGLFLAPLIVGYLTEGDNFVAAILTFSWCAGCAGILVVSLIVSDYLEGKRLNTSAAVWKQRRSLEAEVEAEVEEEKKRLAQTTSVNDYPQYDDF